MTLDERVETGTEQDVLRDPFLDDEILDEASARDDRSSIRTRADRVHVRSLAPAIARCGHRKTDLVLDEVWMVVELHVHGPPERGAHSAAVRFHVREAGGPAAASDDLPGFVA